MDGGACWAAVHGVAKSQTRLSDFPFTFHFHALEKEMATHSSILAWRIPGTRGAWWAAVYGVTQSQTRLERLSSSSSRFSLYSLCSVSLSSTSGCFQNNCVLLVDLSTMKFPQQNFLPVKTQKQNVKFCFFMIYSDFKGINISQYSSFKDTREYSPTYS